MSLDVNKMTKDQLRQHILMLAMELTQLEEENRKLKSDLGTVIDERDNNIKQNKKLRERIKELEIDYDRLKVAFEDVVSGK